MLHAWHGSWRSAERIEDPRTVSVYNLANLLDSLLATYGTARKRWALGKEP
jgi:hypothetical protein